MNKKRKMIEIKEPTFIPFEWIDKTPGGASLGRAEFQVCVKFKRNKGSEFWVYPCQQRRNDECWHYKGGAIDFFITSYENLDLPHIWLITYCQEHKTQTLHIYVPNDARFLKLDYSGMAFCKTDWNARGEA